jgi:hypothetical protein
MATMELPPRTKPTSDRLHPFVHRAAAGLLIWFVVAAWLLFDDAGYLKLALAMITILVFMALAIPWALWRAYAGARSREHAHGTADEAPAAADVSESFDTWLRGRFATWTDQEDSSTAVVEILLPLAAVAFGLTAIGIVFELTRAGVV